jgi:hypothetical protein
MKRENIDELPLYPNQRQCARATTEQILRLFSLAELQRQLLRLLGVPEDAFRPPD